MRKLILLVVLLGAPFAQAKEQVWLYTSIYKEFLDAIEKAFEKKYPDLDLQVFQSGSEKIRAKVQAEQVSGKVQADLIAVSDPFWARELEKEGKTLIRPEPASRQINYFSLMVLIVAKSFPERERPQSFSDLTHPRYKGMIHIGSPLESGTMFSTVALLSELYDWGYFEKLHTNKMTVSGGNSTVIQKVESGEKKIGFVLLENALAAKKRGSPIDIIYPKEGGIPIPSVQILWKDRARPQSAQKLSEFLLSKECQEILRSAWVYPSLTGISSPEGALPLEKAQGGFRWSVATADRIAGKSTEIKKKFSAIFLE
jgi:iron(III) transport system substrate-binding protein